MSWRDWVNIGALKAFSNHVTGFIPALAAYGLLKFVSGYLIIDPFLKLLVELIEDGLLVTVIGMFAWFTIRDIWKRGHSVILFPYLLAA